MVLVRRGISQYGITAMVSIHSISDDGNKEAVKEAVNEFVLRIMDDCETMGYSEEKDGRRKTGMQMLLTF